MQDLTNPVSRPSFYCIYNFLSTFIPCNTINKAAYSKKRERGGGE